jgi:hypothetical protein
MNGAFLVESGGFDFTRLGAASGNEELMEYLALGRSVDQCNSVFLDARQLASAR